MPHSSTTSVPHYSPSLKSELLGVREPQGIVRFRGIPYASVTKRWTHSSIIHSLDSPLDATRFGPRCIQRDGPVLVSGGVTDAIPGDHEFDCLNLNIYAPEDAMFKDSKKLPVMVWVHGGAFCYGANSVGRYRANALSVYAKEQGTPVVIVQINYRLGLFGFAASSDLRTEADASIPECNYGFVDQQNAFEWVQQHIGDFGGDASDVTAFGISAGSASLHYHIIAGKPLFDRAVMMSGSAPTLGPLPMKYYEEAWELMCQARNVSYASAPKRLHALRSLTSEEVMEAYPGRPIGPAADGTQLPLTWSFNETAPSTRCKEIILGDAGVEAIVLDSVSADIPCAEFRRLVRSHLSASIATDLLHDFGFVSDDMPAEQYRDAMRFFLSVMMFQYPNSRIAESFGQIGVAYLYHFEEPSPYEGPTLGLPYHGQDALFMYLNEIGSYPQSCIDISKDLARTWTAFAHGKQPWEPYSKAEAFMRFGPGGKSTLADVKSDGTRQYAYLEWLRAHFEEVKDFVHSLINEQ